MPFSIDDIRELSLRTDALQEEILKAEYEDPEAVKQAPVFNQSESAKYIGISRSTLSSLLDDEAVPRTIEYKEDAQGNKKPLPPKFSAAQIEEIRKYLESKGMKGNWSKRRPSNTKHPITIMIGNLKGGSTKTTVAIHLAQWLSLMGYRVLGIDADPQGSFTKMLGFFSYYFEDLPQEAPYVDDYNTLFSLYSENNPLRPINTYWPNLDVIPANIRGYSSEYFIPARQIKNNEPFWNILNKALKEPVEEWNPNYATEDSDGTPLGPIYDPSDYDICILDCSPSYSYSTMNCIYSADSAIIPVPPNHLDILATGTYFEQMADFLEDIAQEEGQEKNFDFFVGVRSRMNGVDETVANGGRVAAIFRDALLNTQLNETKAIRVAASDGSKTLLEAQGIKGVSSSTVKEAIKNFEAFFEEVEEKIIQAWESQKELDL